MANPLLYTAALAAFLFVSAPLPAAPLHAEYRSMVPSLVDLAPRSVAKAQTLPPMATVPANYTAWVSLPVDRLFALKPASRVSFKLPDIGAMEVVFDHLRKLDAAGKVMEWRGHVPARPNAQVVLVRDVRGNLSGILDLGKQRLLLGHAGNEYLLYVAGKEVPSQVAERSPILETVTLDPDAAEEDKPAAAAFPVSVDLVSLADVPVGGETELTLPEAGTYTLVHDNTLAGDLGASTFVGYLKDYGDDFRVIITSSPAGSVGSILSPLGEFKLLTRNNQTWVVDVNRSGLERMVPDHDDGLDHHADTSLPVPAVEGVEPVMAEAAQAVGTVSAQAAAATTTGAGTDKTNIDVMVLYGPGLEKRLGVDQALARIQYLVALSNQSYIDSQVNINLRLVKAVKLDGLTDNTSNSQTLSDLTAGRGVFAQVPALRKQYGADLVAVLRPFYLYAQGQNCGVGYVGGYGNTPMSGYSGYGYSVVSDGSDVESGRAYCHDYSFTHELGHNMGSMHDRATVASQGGGIGAYPYSFGHGQTGQFGTIMSYISPVVGKFSNPSLNTCAANKACGVSSSSPQSADNAQSLNNTRAAVSAYMPASSAQPVYVSGLASIDGKPLAGVKITGGGATCTATASNGTYSCQMANGWSGTLVPTLAGHTFTPGQLPFSKLTVSMVQQNWKAVAQPVTISGSASLAGKALAGVKITGTGANCTTTASNGTYSCQVSYGWSGTLVPSLAGYTFTPTQLSFSNVTTSKTLQNWSAASQPVTISGTATAAGKALAGVKITGTGANCTTTASNGAYSCQVSYGWSGTLVPSLAGYTFTPSQLTFSKLTVSKTLQNWSAAVQPVTISGTAMAAGKSLAGVKITGTGANCTTTASNGAYSCQVASGWSGTLVPSLAGYSFMPSQLSFSNVTASKSLQNWNALVKTITISGTATYAGKALSGVAVSGAQAQCTSTNASGAYSCQVPFGWSGALQVYKASHLFSPSARVFIQITTSLSQQNWQVIARL